MLVGEPQLVWLQLNMLAVLGLPGLGIMALAENWIQLMLAGVVKVVEAIGSVCFADFV